MRQVNFGELAWQVLITLKLQVSATSWKALATGTTDTRDREMRLLAEKIAKRLDGYEILTEHPEGPPFRMFGDNPQITDDDVERIEHKPLFG